MGALLMVMPLLGDDALENARRQASEFGRQQNSSAFDFIASFDSSQIGNEESFDGREAKQQILSGDVSRTEGREYYRQDVPLDGNEMLFDRAESFAAGAAPVLIEEGVSYTLRKCRQSGAPYVLSADRHLVEETVRICAGHKDRENYGKRKRAKARAKKLRRELEQDPEIASSSVRYQKHDNHSAWVWIEYTHIDDSEACDLAATKPTGKRYWAYEDPKLESLFNSPKCSLLQQQALGEGRERLSFLCQHPRIDECAALSLENCELMFQRCVKSTAAGCAVWEKTFKCFAGLPASQRGELDLGSLYGVSGELVELEEESESSYAQVATTLAVFAEVEQELESAGVNADELGLFGGKSRKCSRNVLNKVLYDCCFSMGGLATQAQLAKCNAEEKALAKLREQGRCHYVGSYDKEFLGMWTSSKQHVYCCFPSKLGRVVQEEARKQLGLGWGKPKEPKCKGLSAEQIAQVDFNQMDLSELYEDQLKQANVNIDAKLAAFQARLEQVEGGR